ncbi:MAG: DUF1515 family protein [Shinella sp.]|jgi:hypothetical protein|nr:DUF1515 family protein [Shinella sp.]
MTPPEYDAAVHRQLGELVAGMKGLQDAFVRMEQQNQRSEDKSLESRSKVHKRMDELVDRVGKVETSVATVQDDVKEMKPVTDEVRRWKLMGMGALGVIGIGALAAGVTFAEAIRRIARIVVGG